MPDITQRELTGEKLQEFKDLTAAFIEDMESYTNEFQTQVDEIQQTYIDQLKEVTKAMTEKVTARSAQYLEDLKAIFGDEEEVPPTEPVEPAPTTP